MRLIIDGVEYHVHFRHTGTRWDAPTGVQRLTQARLHAGACDVIKDEGPQRGQCRTDGLVALAAPGTRERREVFFDRHGAIRTRVRVMNVPFNYTIGRHLAFARVLLNQFPSADPVNRARRTEAWVAYLDATRSRDRCELCAGKRGGVRGGEWWITVEHTVKLACAACTEDHVPLAKARKAEWI